MATLEKALKKNSISQLMQVPKSDIHSHGGKGGRIKYIAEWAKAPIKASEQPFDDLDDMQNWFNSNIKIHDNGKEGYLKRVEAAFAQAKEDHIAVLALSFIIAVDKEFVLLNPVDKHGEEIGLLLINLSNIFMFDYDLEYAKKVMKLFELKNQQKKALEVLNSNALFSLFEKAIEQKGLIEINNDSNYIGYIKKYNEELLELELMDNYGNDLGIAYIDINRINVVQYRDLYLRDLELLYGRK